MRFHEHYVSDGRGGSEMVSREPWPVTFEEFVNDLRSKRKAAIDGGIVLDCGGVPVWFGTSLTHQAGYLAMLRQADMHCPPSLDNDPVDGWREKFIQTSATGQRAIVEMTRTGLMQVIDTVDQHVRQCFAMERQYLEIARSGGISLDELHEKMQTNWPGAN